MLCVTNLPVRFAMRSAEVWHLVSGSMQPARTPLCVQNKSQMQAVNGRRVVGLLTATVATRSDVDRAKPGRTAQRVSSQCGQKRLALTCSSHRHTATTPANMLFL